MRAVRSGGTVPLLPEEGGEEGGAFRFPDAVEEGDAVVQAGIVHDRGEADAGARLRIESAEDEAVQAGEDDRAGAQEAWFEGDVDRRPLEAAGAR